MSTMVDERLRRLRSELDDHSRIADRLGLDLERPLRSLNDGYPENAVALVGKLTEKLLKELWRHHGIEGDPSTKALNDLVKRCRPYIRSSTVLDALEDIRRLRNRSTHDGYDISDEDGLLAVRRLVDVLVWFTDTGSAALLGGEPDMAPEVARRCEFLAGLYVTLGYRQAKRFVLSPDTVYQLFCRESGMRLEYVELMLSRDADDLSTVLASSGGELLRTRLPKLTRFVVLDDDGRREHPAPSITMLGLDFRIVRYDGFVDTIVNLDTHLADLTSADSPGGAEGRCRRGGVDHRSPHRRVDDGAVRGRGTAPDTSGARQRERPGHRSSGERQEHAAALTGRQPGDPPLPLLLRPRSQTEGRTVLGVRGPPARAGHDVGPLARLRPLPLPHPFRDRAVRAGCGRRGRGRSQARPVSCGSSPISRPSCPPNRRWS